MTKSKPLRILDPIHGLIQFDRQPFQELLECLVDSSVMQRLRNIRQLGFTEYVYPGATHHRFCHSLGVACITRKILKRLSEQAEFSLQQQKRLIVAALLHDIGHGPFSHVFEQVEPESDSHVVTGRRLLENAELQDIFRHHGMAGETESLAELWEPSRSGGQCPSSIISGALDADRLDYLRRDQVMTGSHQGQFDWPWMLDNLIWGEKGLMLGHRSVNAAEAFLLVRAHLYQTVYYHRTVRGIERMFVLLLRRYRDFCQKGDAKKFSRETDFSRWFTTPPQERTAEDFLRLSDHSVHRLFADLAECDDKELCNYAQCFRRRKFPHCFDADPETRDHWWHNLETGQQRQEFEREYSVGVDRVEFSAYDEKSPIWIQDSNGNSRDLAELSPVAQGLREPTRYLRFYYTEQKHLERVLAKMAAIQT